jgi:molybdopterin molybdotransferase
MKAPPIPLEEAQRRLLALAVPLPVERTDVASATRRYLAEPLAARRTHPGADLSAMDGYAVVSGDLAGPWEVIGESAAGHPFAGTLKAGQAVRIATGAVLPAGANAVIVQEDVTRRGTYLMLSGDAPSPESRHIRRRGMDFTQGAVVLPAGVLLGPAQLALAVSCGQRHVAVRRLARVAIIDSGDELASDIDDCAAHQVPASNGVMLSAMAAELPCTVTRRGPVRDDHDALVHAFEQAGDADLIVTSGGASVGDHDLVRPALESWGAEIDFWRVAIKPGKPLLVARRARGAGQQLILGLPGNPVSSHVTAFLFMLPLLRALGGAADPLPWRLRTTLGEPLRAGGKRREFLRAHWNGESIAAHALQDSGALSALASSNALIDREAAAAPAAAGSEVMAYVLGNGGIA